MNRLGVVLLLYFLLEAVSVSCSLICPCGCDTGSTPKRMDIQSWSVYTAGHNFEMLDTTKVYDYNKVLKIIQVDERLYVSTQESVGNMISTAYACSPAPVESIQKIESIQLISRNEIALTSETDLIPVGTDLNPRFVMTFHGASNPEPINTFIQDLIIYDDDRYELQLNQKPFDETTLKFDLIITMSDGKVTELRNQVMKVK